MFCVSSICLIWYLLVVCSCVFVCGCVLCGVFFSVSGGLLSICIDLIALSGMCGLVGGVHVGHGVSWLIVPCWVSSVCWKYFFRSMCGMYL